MSRPSVTAAVSTDLKPVGLDGNPEVPGVEIRRRSMGLLQ